MLQIELRKISNELHTAINKISRRISSIQAETQDSSEGLLGRAIHYQQGVWVPKEVLRLDSEGQTKYIESTNTKSSHYGMSNFKYPKYTGLLYGAEVVFVM